MCNLLCTNTSAEPMYECAVVRKVFSEFPLPFCLSFLDSLYDTEVEHGFSVELPRVMHVRSHYIRWQM
jgi:hypothetical protein